MTAEEEWRPIPGFADYFASDQGRILSTKWTKPRVMKLTPERSGYLFVQLCMRNQIYARRVHRLVLEAFVGPRPDGYECRHLNDVKSDNRLVNLKWGTTSENGLDRVRNGIHPMAAKTHCLNGHEFTPDNISRRKDRPRARVCRACSRERAIRESFRAAGIRAA